jgi:Spy/CpxP family protein refolding chaperone
MKKNMSLLLGMALTTCFIAPHCFAQGAPALKSDNGLNQQDQVKTIFSFKNEIGLTDDQEIKLKALLYDQQARADAHNNTLRALGTELGKMIDEKEDMQIIKSKLEEISKIQVEISFHRIEDSRKVEGILTPDQLVRWKDIQKRFASQART